MKAANVFERLSLEAKKACADTRFSKANMLMLEAKVQTLRKQIVNFRGSLQCFDADLSEASYRCRKSQAFSSQCAEAINQNDINAMIEKRDELLKEKLARRSVGGDWLQRCLEN